MNNKFFKRTTISLINTFRQSNVLKFQFNSVKFFGKLVLLIIQFKIETFIFFGHFCKNFKNKSIKIQVRKRRISLNLQILKTLLKK